MVQSTGSLTSQGLGQQRRGFVDVLGDQDRAVAGVLAVLQIAHVVREGQHHDFVFMRGLAFGANEPRPEQPSEIGPWVVPVIFM